ncbi:hypothetical protein [Vibrio sp. SCSIO 43136]|uniref:hypothetical protein n=1 Tax=Vibrio sp. SCSIO 43136 TaxID=2819101 RepID=UPI002074FF20|nr:hypothetical protein [Vibrio sp. SCSIO 43136]USD67284.1 hypothetical protein J4N39_21880 [Vibrio sp. SCSIO 43136]
MKNSLSILFLFILTFQAHSGELTSRIKSYSDVTLNKDSAIVLAEYWSDATIEKFFDILPSAKEEFYTYIHFSDKVDSWEDSLESYSGKIGCVFLPSNGDIDYLMVDLVKQDKRWKIDKVTSVYSPAELINFDQCHNGTMRRVDKALNN